MCIRDAPIIKYLDICEIGIYVTTFLVNLEHPVLDIYY